MNRAVISGRITADPELKHTQSGKAVVSLSIAVDRRYSKDGERITDFVDVVAWNGTAEFICKYWRKGKWMEVCGMLQTRTYEDRNGYKHKITELVADSVGFGGEKKSESTPDGEPNRKKEARTIVPEYDPELYGDEDDGDLPF